MAMYYVSADLKFEEDEPDGSICQCCDEVIYLNQWSCHVLVMGTVAGVIKLCEGCKDCFEAMREEAEDEGLDEG